MTHYENSKADNNGWDITRELLRCLYSYPVHNVHEPGR